MASNSDVEDRKLSEIFINSLDLFEKIQNSNEASNSKAFQTDLRNCIQKLEEATKLVNIGGVFSTNETFEEIATNNVKYLLLPAILGILTLKLQKEERIAVLETAEVYLKDFLRRIRDYAVVPNIKVVEDEENEAPPRPTFDLNQLAKERNEKIKKFEEQKELDESLNHLKQIMKSQNCEEEQERKYYITYIKKLVNAVYDELKSIKQEIPLAQHMARVRNGEAMAGNELKEVLPKLKPLKPIIITKNELQKKVFGAGYPSLPTFTVQEFYDQRVADGIFPAPGQGSYNKTLQDLSDPNIAAEEDEKEAMRKENEIENDDSEYLERTRNMDEYKDTHKRGWGNRMNRS